MKRWNRIIVVLVSLMVIGLAIRPLAHSGFPDNHDRDLYLNWLYEFDQGIHDGHLLPRWAPDVWAGYGSPIFNFIQPGFYYGAEALHLLGFSLIISVKGMIALSILLGYIFMFLWAKEVWKNQWAALISATLYTWAPYHLASIYLRGSFAELLALGIWPLILFAIARILTTESRKYFFLIALATAALLLTHNILSLIFVPAAILYVLLNAWGRWRQIWVIAAAALTGAGLSAFFWLPAFVERTQVSTELLFAGNRAVENNFLNLSQLVTDEWQNYAFLLGLTSLCVLIFSVYAVLERKAIRLRYGKIYFWVIPVLVLSVVMSLHASQFIWDAIPFLKYFQFPWRFLSLASLALAILGGILITFRSTKHRSLSPKTLALLFVVATVLINISYAAPASYLPAMYDADYRPNREREIEVRTKQLAGEKTISTYFFAEMPEFFTTHSQAADLQNAVGQAFSQWSNTLKTNPKAQLTFPKKFEVVSGQALLKEESVRTSYYSARINVTSPAVLQINALWFPGWKISLDGKQIAPTIRDGLGVMQIPVPVGEFNVVASFSDTPIRIVARMVSIFTTLAFLVLIAFQPAFRKKRKTT